MLPTPLLFCPCLCTFPLHNEPLPISSAFRLSVYTELRQNMCSHVFKVPVFLLSAHRNFSWLTSHCLPPFVTYSYRTWAHKRFSAATFSVQNNFHLTCTFITRVVRHHWEETQHVKVAIKYEGEPTTLATKHTLLSTCDSRDTRCHPSDGRFCQRANVVSVSLF